LLVQRRYQMLSFALERVNYYDSEVVKIYLNNLPNLHYFIVERLDSSFVCLLPISSIREHGEFNTERINRFILALERGNVLPEFIDEAIVVSARLDDTLISVLKKVRLSRRHLLPIVSENNILIGIATEGQIEKRIAEEVIAAYGGNS